jgi:hypothetical protein
VLDNEPLVIPSSTNGVFQAGTYPSQILPYSLGVGGSLGAETAGPIPDDVDLANPIFLLVENKGKYIYVANQGNNVAGQNANSGIAGYDLFTAPVFQLEFMQGEPFGSGSGPQCIVEDPSDQFIYEADQFDSTVVGREVEPNDGILDDLRVVMDYKLQGPASWCLVDGRTS